MSQDAAPGTEPPGRGWRPGLLEGLLPVERARIPVEAIAGVTLATLAIPEVMGYTQIAGMPVVTGLYTILLPLIAFAILGSSRHLVVGADSATAAILAAGLAGMAATGSAQYVALASLLALMAGALLVAARLLRLGFLADFLSRTVLIGFLTGVGIQVACGQLAGMIGVDKPSGGPLKQVAGVAGDLGSADLTTVAVSASVLGLILIGGRLGPKIPWALFAVVGSIVASSALDLPAHGVATVGTVPGGLPSIGLPDVTWSRVRRAARHRRDDLLRDPRAERCDLARVRDALRRPVRREHRPARARRRERDGRPVGHVRRERQPDEDRDGRHRRRPLAARAALRGGSSSWSCSSS